MPNEIVQRSSGVLLRAMRCACHGFLTMPGLRPLHAARYCYGWMGTRGARPAEWDEALQALNEPVSHLRTEALDTLSSLLTQQGWSLAPVETASLVVALRERLLDSNWVVCQRALGLVAELVSQTDERIDELAAHELVQPIIEKVRTSDVARDLAPPTVSPQRRLCACVTAGGRL